MQLHRSRGGSTAIILSPRKLNVNVHDAGVDLIHRARDSPTLHRQLPRVIESFFARS